MGPRVRACMTEPAFPSLRPSSPALSRHWSSDAPSTHPTT
jgi:hypothetical protein